MLSFCNDFKSFVLESSIQPASTDNRIHWILDDGGSKKRVGSQRHHYRVTAMSSSSRSAYIICDRVLLKISCGFSVDERIKLSRYQRLWFLYFVENTGPIVLNRPLYARYSLVRIIHWCTQIVLIVKAISCVGHDSDAHARQVRFVSCGTLVSRLRVTHIIGDHKRTRQLVGFLVHVSDSSIDRIIKAGHAGRQIPCGLPN